MKVKAMVLMVEEFQTKKGIGQQLVCLDVSEGDHQLKNTFDYGINDGDKEFLASAKAGSVHGLKGKTLVVGLNNIEEGFGKRLRCRGSIIEVMK